jgi:hypothetical protein
MLKFRGIYELNWNYLDEYLTTVVSGAYLTSARKNVPLSLWDKNFVRLYPRLCTRFLIYETAH